MERLIKNNKFQDFTSFIFPCESLAAILSLNKYLSKYQNDFESYFNDIEIIILIPISLQKDLEKNLNIKETLRKDMYLITISFWKNWDSSIFTSLARANGDIVYILDPYYPGIFNNILKINNLFLKDYDIYLFQNKFSYFNFQNRIFNFLLYFFLKLISSLPFSSLDRREMVLSRRSVNFILKNSQNNILITELAYRSSYPYKKIKVNNKKDETISKAFFNNRKVQWSLLMRLSNLPGKISSFSIIILLLFVSLTSINALMVRFYGVNILLNKEVIVPGWTYLVIVISLTSLLLSLSMYSLQQSLNIIHDELCQRDFEVNSYKRFY